MKLLKIKPIKVLCLLLATVMFICVVGCGCSKGEREPEDGKIPPAVVNFIDVGQGDCTFIVLPDGKFAMIDTGDNGYDYYPKIESFLDYYSVTKIDYLFLTHPDVDHLGNAYSLISDYEIGKVFLPYVYQGIVSNVFSELERVEALIDAKNIPTEYNEILKSVKGENYSFTFLSPESRQATNGLYADYDLFSPTENQINNISSVIYFECLGVRFLFTGDISKSVESRIIERYVGTSIYQDYANIQNINISLYSVDFLKVAHHGSADATSEEFLSIVKPKNAVISSGGYNNYGHPATEVLLRLSDAKVKANVLRTDSKGSIVVAIGDDSKYSINTQID